MVCHVKKDEFLLLLDNHVEAAWEKIGHIMIMFEAMIGDKYPDVSINLYSGIYYLESRGYRPEEIFRIGKTLKTRRNVIALWKTASMRTARVRGTSLIKKPES